MITDRPTSSSSCPRAPGQSPLTLRFACNTSEAAYQEHFSTVHATTDRASVLIYFLMVAPGLFTSILAAAGIKPELWNEPVQACVPYTVTTVATLLLHVALLALAPAWYRARRCLLVTGIRALFALSSVARGLQQCSTVTKWVAGECVDESVFSAFLWRSGVIALFFHAMAFRLPFTIFFEFQCSNTILYAALLAPAVCSNVLAVQFGERVVAAGQQLLAYVRLIVLELVLGGGGGDFLAFQQPPGDDACLSSVWLLQFLLGHLLVTIALYLLEARDRSQWWQAQQQRRRRRQQQPALR